MPTKIAIKTFPCYKMRIQLPSHNQHSEGRPTVPDQTWNKAPGLQKFMSSLGFTPGDRVMELNWTNTAKVKASTELGLLSCSKQAVEIKVQEPHMVWTDSDPHTSSNIFSGLLFSHQFYTC